MISLHDKTIDLLNKSTIPLPQIAVDNEVGYRWLCDFKSGRFSDPGVNKVERLFKYLSENSKEARVA